ncbi:MAG: zinc-finger domain-containing protein [Alphaproteobacteria bacterium]|nr:zinc-finger domain-containing protein [Alphaproteobacteria bacterium]
MAHDTSTPYFQNSMGLPRIEVGAHEFMCIGALPPYDHPHVFLDMGQGSEIICPYCSTLYAHNKTLANSAAKPAEAAWAGDKAA